MGCDLILEVCSAISKAFQSTHPRGVRLNVNYGTTTLRKISIHAPTWGATALDEFFTSTWFNFNPRTHVGCDATTRVGTSPVSYFNPRTHVGCDIAKNTVIRWSPNFNPRTHVGCDQYVYLSGRQVLISIHAPTWGATPPQLQSYCTAEISIHAPTWGATPEECLLSCKQNFNPRTHVGCDFSGFVTL